MKRGKAFAVTMAILCAITNPAVADIYQDCKPTEKAAVMIMRARQAGYQMSEMIDAAKAASSNNLFVEITIDAYRAPIVTGAVLRQRIIAEFGNKWYARCIAW